MTARGSEPVRHCVVCRRGRAKHELVRVVRSPEGEVGLDVGGKAPGRGAYVCPERRCIDRAGARLAGALKVRGDLGHLLKDWTE